MSECFECFDGITITNTSNRPLRYRETWGNDKVIKFRDLAPGESCIVRMWAHQSLRMNVETVPAGEVPLPSGMTRAEPPRSI